MPAKPRKHVIDPTMPGVYHCYNRVVRRAKLFGQDVFTGKNFKHRKQWVKARLKRLASAFAVDVLDFSTMDNHLHVLLRNRPDVVERWSDEEVARRWWQACPKRKGNDGNPEEPKPIELAEWLEDPEEILKLRERLSSISWFMKLLCEYIAKCANREDGLTGAFWEDRFKCEAIKDLAALLACSMYINLNPIRACQAETPETSEHTSLYERIQALLNRGLQITPFEDAESRAAEGEIAAATVSQTTGTTRTKVQPGGGAVSEEADDWLAPLTLQETWDGAGDGGVSLAMETHFPAPCASNKGYLPMGLPDYVRFLEWTGKQVREDKPGAIPADLLPFAERLGINLEYWADLVAHFPKRFKTAAGNAESLRAEAARRGQRWLHGLRYAERVFT